jgi:hypothetical protein
MINTLTYFIRKNSYIISKKICGSNRCEFQSDTTLYWGFRGKARSLTHASAQEVSLPLQMRDGLMVSKENAFLKS